MQIMNIPEEVMQDFVYPHLSLNDLLRLRRVCIRLENITTKYLQKRPYLIPQIEINENGETGKTIESFLKMNIPTCNVYFKNAELGSKFYDINHSCLKLFIEKMGTLVNTIRVARMSAFLRGSELDILGSFTNLMHLNVGSLDFLTDDVAQTVELRSIVTNTNPFLFPSNFQLLKSITVTRNCTVEVKNQILYMIGFLRHGVNLEQIKFPYDNCISAEVSASPEWLIQPTRRVGVLDIYFVYQKDIITNPLSKLKFVDFLNYNTSVIQNRHDVEFWASRQFLMLCVKALDKNVKLENVGANWFIHWHLLHHLRQIERIAAPEVGRAVYSMINITPACFGIDLSNLKSINILSTSACIVDRPRMLPAPNWPSLESLKICIDSRLLYEQNWTFIPTGDGVLMALPNANINTDDLFHCLFRGVTHVHMRTLELDFKICNTSIPNVEHISASCPGITRLKITNWPGTNCDLSKLLIALVHLKALCIGATCTSKVGDDAFWNKTNDQSAFAQNTNLKELFLYGLDNMLKITDFLFFNVVSQLRLSRFTITSSTPITSVTMAGVKCLLQEDSLFSKSIDHFSFQGWCLDGVSISDLKKLEKKFRSFDML